MMQKGDVTVRKAVVDDVKDIHALLMQAALKGQLLPRALTYLYGHVRNFFVLVKPDGEIVGCVALAPVWEDLAEVASLVIREDQRGKGLGLLAVQACLADCPSIGIKRVFALTAQHPSRSDSDFQVPNFLLSKKRNARINVRRLISILLIGRRRERRFPHIDEGGEKNGKRKNENSFKIL